jgi:hypothetical protein
MKKKEKIIDWPSLENNIIFLFDFVCFLQFSAISSWEIDFYIL